MAKNRVCELLGIRFPIIQAPMNWISGADLVAAVSEAGGLGTLGPNAGTDGITDNVELVGERLRNQIRRVRGATNQPFAVNVAVGVGDAVKFSEKVVEVMVAEKVPVAIVSVGKPEVYSKTLKDAGTKVLHAVSTVRHAKKAEDIGVDGVICEGFEAGGHKGRTELTTFVLTPMVADAVNIPVITGGGIGDARGIIAALVLGADGVYMGTRFMATEESESHPKIKERIVSGEDACTVSVDKGFMLARDLRNAFTEKFTELRRKGAPEEELMKLWLNSQYRAQRLGEAEDAEVCCGQVAGLIRRVDKAADVIREITGSIGPTADGLKRKLADFTGEP